MHTYTSPTLPPHARSSPTLHLNQKLRLHSTRRLRLRVIPLTAQRIDLVDEHNARLPLSGHFKQALDALLALAQPLRQQIRRAHRDERALALGGDGLRQIGLARTRRLQRDDEREREHACE